jgi:glycosyltransferase involved in cell wall biosynthesis
VVETIQDKYRKKDGWEIPDIGSIDVIVAPSNEEFKTLFKNKDDIHIFSGISAYPLVYKGFKKAIKNKSRIGILSEPINFSGLKGFLKLFRGKYQCLRFNKNIDFIAATGDLGVKTYRSFGYSWEKIFQWGYFVELKVKEEQNFEKNNKLIFVGNLNHNKQIYPLLKLFIENKGFDFVSFDILGNGSLSEFLFKYIHDKKYTDRIKLHGRLFSEDTYKLIARSSLLVLPSLSDGWGVVVNEALLSGTPVIASSNVGAKVLINEKRGDIFDVGNYILLKDLLYKWSNKKMSKQDYDSIKNWATKSISPEVATEYFLNIIDYIYNNREVKPKAPWL